MRLSPVLLSLSLLLTAFVLHAESKNPADYPLRIHIFRRSETTFYRNRQTEEAKGDGRANLFENGQVHAVDFSFECPEKLDTSFGYETFMARWKKPGQELVVLFPVMGKANAYYTCNLKTMVKDTAYLTHNGSMSSEPAAQFHAWMVKHNYDPEHGKNTPTNPDPVSAQPSMPTSVPAGPQTSAAPPQ